VPGGRGGKDDPVGRKKFQGAAAPLPPTSRAYVGRSSQITNFSLVQTLNCTFTTINLKFNLTWKKHGFPEHSRNESNFVAAMKITTINYILIHRSTDTQFNFLVALWFWAQSFNQ